MMNEPSGIAYDPVTEPAHHVIGAGGSPSHLIPNVPTARTSARGQGTALAVIGGAQLMIVLDGTIVNIALPHLQSALGLNPSGLSWVVNAYVLAFGSLLLLGGRIGDLLGRRRMFVLGVLLFAAASLAGGLAANEATLLAARAIQGVGAAIASPAALALITTTFSAGKPRNRAMGVYAAMSGAGSAVGLILGGVLTEIDWRWVFFVNVPLGLSVAVLAPRHLAESARHQGRFDLRGALSGTAGLTGIVWGLTHAASAAGWNDAVTIGSLLGGGSLLMAFVLIERSSPHALLPFRILADRTRGVSLLTMLTAGAGIAAMFFFLGLYMQQVLGYSPLESGYAFLPFSIVVMVAAGLASSLASRVDPRWISGPGALLGVVGMWGLTHLSTTSSYATGLLPWMLLLASSLGLIFVPMTLTTVHGVRSEDSGAASAALNTMQQIGGAIGLAALTTVFSHAFSSKATELAAAVSTHPVSGGRPTAAQLAAMRHQIALAAQTYASTQGFLVGAGIVLLAAMIVLAGLNIKHQALGTRDPRASTS